MNSYLDETGDLRRRNTKYFIIGTFTVGDPKRIKNAFRRWQKSKFPRKLKGQTEVKFNDSHLTDGLRLKTIKYLAKQDIRIFYTYLKLTNIPEKYRKEGKVHETGLLYTELVGYTLELYLPLADIELRVYRDPRSLKGISVEKFNGMVKAHLLPLLPVDVLFSIDAPDSTTNPLIQVADWVCGALGRYHEGKTLGQEFYNALKKNIIQEKELFSDYWIKKWER